MNRKQSSTPAYTSLEDMYQDIHKLLYVICRDYVSNPQDREDVLSIVWCKITEDPEFYLSLNKDSLFAYLRVVIRHTALDYLHREQREQEKFAAYSQMMQDMLSDNAVEREVFLSADLNYMQEACQVLTEKEKLLLLLRFSMRMKFREVAQHLSCSEGAVRVMQHRILRKLQRKIEDIKKREEGE